MAVNSSDDNWTMQWFQRELAPIFSEINAIICANQDLSNGILGYCWYSYYKQTLAFFEFVMNKNYVYQTIESMRCFMEYAADVHFISLYPQNLPTVTAECNKVISENIQHGQSLFDLAEAASKIRLHSYQNGVKRTPTTNERIKIAFGEDGLAAYHYFSCYIHLNIVGVMLHASYDMLDEDFRREQRLQITRIYPETTRIILTALGKIYHIAELVDFDYNKIKSKIAHLS